MEKVVVHEADKSSGTRIQQVDIYLNFIGKVDLSGLDETEEPQKAVGSRGRKLRRDMSEEVSERA